MSDKLEELAKALMEITLEYGPFNTSSGSDGCDYKSASNNKTGKSCADCLFYRGGGCAIVYGNIEADGICRFYVIEGDDEYEEDSKEQQDGEDGNDGQDVSGQKSISEEEIEDPYEEEMNELLNQSVNFAKSLPVSQFRQESDYVYTGLGVVFGGKDLVGDTFTKDTQFGLERSVKGMPVFFDHALEDVKDQIGTVLEAKTDDAGIWFQFQINKRHKYAERIKQLIDDGQLGLSTGALSHVVMRDSGNIKRWITGELSVTPTPADPRTRININGQQVEHEASVDALPQEPSIIFVRKKRN